MAGSAQIRSVILILPLELFAHDRHDRLRTAIAVVKAREILRSFFQANTPRSFRVTHKASESNKKYMIGLLNAGGELFQVTIYATSSAGEPYKIQQLNISRQTAY